MRALLGVLLLCVACGSEGTLVPMPPDAGPDAAGPPSCGALGEACCNGATCAAPLRCTMNTCGCSVSTDCPASGTCTDGRCLIALARDQSGPYPIAVDASNVYWVNAGYMATPSTIVKVARTGGTPVVLGSYPSMQSQDVWSLVVAGTNLYTPVCTAILSVPIAGGDVTTFAQPSGCALQLAADPANLYWTDVGGGMFAAPTGGGAARALFGTRGGAAGSFAVQGTSVYWAGGYVSGSTPTAAILRGSLTDGTVTTLVPLANSEPYNVAVNATAIVWSAQWSVQSLSSAPLGGGSPTTLATGIHARRIAVDDAFLYWADDETGTISKIPVAGGTPTTLFTGDQPFDIAVDATSVYWTSPPGGAVWRLSPK